MLADSYEAVTVPVVCVVLEGGPNTIETVKNAISCGTPAIIVQVNEIFALFMHSC